LRAYQFERLGNAADGAVGQHIDVAYRGVRFDFSHQRTDAASPGFAAVTAIVIAFFDGANHQRRNHAVDTDTVNTLFIGNRGALFALGVDHGDMRFGERPLIGSYAGQLRAGLKTGAAIQRSNGQRKREEFFHGGFLYFSN